MQKKTKKKPVTPADCQKSPIQVFYKRTILKNFTISTGTTSVGVSFLKVQVSVKACNFIKKTPELRSLLVNIAKFLRLLISRNICEQLRFDCFNGSLLHGPKGSTFRLYDNVKLHSLSYKSRFSF